MIKLLNDYYRKFFLDYINNIMKEKDISCNEAIIEFYNNYMLKRQNLSLKTNEDKFNSNFMDRLNCILFLDAFKYNIYLQKCGITDLFDYEMYHEILSMLLSIKDELDENIVNDIMSKEIDEWIKEDFNTIDAEGPTLSEEVFNLFNNKETTLYILRKAYDFMKLDKLQKTLVFNTFTEEDNYILSSNNLYHIEDIENYSYKDIDIKYLKEYISNWLNNLIRLTYKTGGNVEADIIYNRIKSYIYSLINYKNEEGIKLILQLAKIEYLGLKYLLNEATEDLKTYISLRIKFYEENDIDTIEKYLSSEGLDDLVVNFINFYVQKEYEGIKFNDTIEKSKESEEVIKKLTKEKSIK